MDQWVKTNSVRLKANSVLLAILKINQYIASPNNFMLMISVTANREKIGNKSVTL